MATMLKPIEAAFAKIQEAGINTDTITALFEAIAEVIINLVKKEI